VFQASQCVACVQVKRLVGVPGVPDVAADRRRSEQSREQIREQSLGVAGPDSGRAVKRSTRWRVGSSPQ
jgi:hypothetical protein